MSTLTFGSGGLVTGEKSWLIRGSGLLLRVECGKSERGVDSTKRRT